MSMAMIYIEGIIFILLSALHIYWGFGGEWGFDESLPTNEEGKRMLNPKKKDSLIVGFGLLFFAFFYLMKTDMITFEVPAWVLNVAGWLIPSIFLLRAMGDFRYIGFFKKLTTTAFADRDSKIFSPLCLILGLNGVLIQMNFY